MADNLNKRKPPKNWRKGLENAQKAPRCGAKKKNGAGLCKAPAYPNGRCRMHGGTSPGAPKGDKNGNYKHGYFTQEAMREREFYKQLLKESRKTVEEMI